MRDLSTSDEQALRRAFEAADPAVLRSRFGGAVPRFSQIVDRLRDLDGVARCAVGAFDETGNVVGVAEYVQSRPDGPADVALVVAQAWQRQGVGAALLRTIAERAVRSGIETATALVSGSNVQVRQLMRDLLDHPDISYDHGAGTLVVDLRGLAGQVPAGDAAPG